MDVLSWIKRLRNVENNTGKVQVFERKKGFWECFKANM